MCMCERTCMCLCVCVCVRVREREKRVNEYVFWDKDRIELFHRGKYHLPAREREIYFICYNFH